MAVRRNQYQIDARKLAELTVWLLCGDALLAPDGEEVTPPAKCLNQHWAIELRYPSGTSMAQPSFLGHVFQYHSSAFKSFYVRQPQVSRQIKPLKQPTSVSEYERVDNDAKQINQMLAKQDPVKRSCPVLHDVFAWLFFDPSNFLHNVSVDNGRIPGRLLEGRRRHVFAMAPPLAPPTHDR
jgi:hypothetical protein